MPLEEIEKWFSEYVGKFSCDNAHIMKNIELKEEHSMKVRCVIRELAIELGLTEADVELAETIGLLHDIGRFEQFKRYGTYYDPISVDHAQLGLDILGKEGILSMFEPRDRSIVSDSIGHHNKASLPESMEIDHLFFCRLLRDADKIDILGIVTSHYENGDDNPSLVLQLPETPGISENVYEDIANERIVDQKNMKNVNDFKVLQMSWAFDFNFGPSMRMALKRKYFEKLRDSLPNDVKTGRIYDIVNAHIIKKLEEQKDLYLI